MKPEDLMLNKSELQEALSDYYVGDDFHVGWEYFDVSRATVKKMLKWLLAGSMDAHTTIFQVSTKDKEAILKYYKVNDGS